MSGAQAEGRGHPPGEHEHRRHKRCGSTTRSGASPAHSTRSCGRPAFCAGAGLPFQVNTTVTRLNADDLGAIYDLARAMGAAAWHVFLLVPVGRGEGLKGEELSAAMYEEVLGWLYEREEEGRIEMKVTCAPHYYRIVKERGGVPKSAGCLAGKSFLFISHRGIAQPCGYLELACGDVRADGVRKVWEGSRELAVYPGLPALQGQMRPVPLPAHLRRVQGQGGELKGDFLEAEPYCSYTERERKEGQRMSRVFLVDGNSYVYRAFFATPYLSNSKGTPTNAIYAFVNMIRKLINEQKPDYMMVVWDSKAPSFRAQISQEYKATRPPMPGNLSLQFPYVKAIVEKMGIATIEKEGFEADDVIATLVRRLAAGPDAEIYVVTSDKDIMQLVGENVTIVDTMKNAVMKRAEVAEKFGIEPSLISDFLALSGDTSDNIPGVPGIGEKTARELICAFGGVEAIYASLDAIKKPSVRQKLAENRERADLSRQLATLRFDVPVDVGLEDMRIREPDLAELRQLFRELEFTSLAKEIKVEDASQPLVQAASLGDVLGGTVSLVARIEGRCPYDVTLQGMAVSNGRGVFSSQRAEDLFSAVNGAKEVVVHNLKPLFLAATKRGIDLHPVFFRHDARRLSDQPGKERLRHRRHPERIPRQGRRRRRRRRAGPLRPPPRRAEGRPRGASRRPRPAPAFR